MRTVQEQINMILCAIEILKIVKIDERYDFVHGRIDIEALLDASETLNRVQNLSDYLNPED